MDLQNSKSLILFILSIYLCVYRTAPISGESDNSPSFYKFSRFGLLSSSGLTLKSKNNIFGCKFPAKPTSPLNFLNLLLILSGNIERNPGPTKPSSKSKKNLFPCGICNKQCTWRQPSVACDSCNIWFHQKCLFMRSAVFDNLHNVSWYCLKCGLPNFSSELFANSKSSLNCSNSFQLLNSSASFENEPTPIYTSTPKSSSCAPKLKSSTFSGLNILVINFQSFFKKRAEFSNFVNELECDVVIGSETWLSPDHLNSELLLDDYDIFRKDRNSHGGGVLLAVKKSLCAEIIPSSSDTESVFCKINVKGKKPIVFGSVYRPPSRTDFDYSLKIVSELHNIFNKFKTASLWFGGDFNLPDINWKTSEITGNQYPHSLNSLYLDMSQDLCLDQIVNVPTRGPNILDLIFTNRPDIAKEPEALAGLGDHECVFSKISLKVFRKKPAKREILLWTKADNENMINDCKTFKSKFFETFDSTSNVLEIWDFIKSEIQKIIQKNVPSKITSSKQHQPWINTKTKQLLRKKERWYSKAKKLNNVTTWKTYKKIKSQCQNACRQTHNQYLDSIFADDTSNKKLFAYVKSRKQENVGIPDLKSERGLPIRDPKLKADLIHKQFDSVFSNPSPPVQAPEVNFDKIPTIPDIEVTSPGIRKLLEKIDPHKAIGPDKIPGQFLKLCAAEMADILTTLFNASLSQGVVPPDWKTANIVPLFKKGDKSNPANYRPISLTSLTCKILEHVVFSNFMSHFEKFSILDDAQHGFRKNRSCVSQLITTLDDFANTLKNQHQTDAILLDFSKAFDKVDHLGLLSKLETYGIRGPLLEWTSSFLIGRKQSVVVDGHTSSPSDVLSGVPQGTVLGPLFFLVYINDISKGLTKGTTIRLFADDSLLYRPIKSPKDCEILQHDLNTLQNWEKIWKMEFHPGKCNLLQITNKRNPIDFIYNIHNTPLQKVDSAKYLGVVVDSKLNWKPHYSHLISNCKKTLSFIRRNLPKAPRFVKSRCYTTLVRPKAEYASSVWDPYQKLYIDRIERIQKSAARFVTGNYKMESGNTATNLNFLGWKTLEERRTGNKLSIFNKGLLGKIDIPTDHLKLNTRTTRRGGGGPQYTKEFSKIDAHRNSFYPSVTRLYNKLPLEIRSCQDADKFADMISKIDLVALKNSLTYID